MLFRAGKARETRKPRRRLGRRTNKKKQEEEARRRTTKNSFSSLPVDLQNRVIIEGFADRSGVRAKCSRDVVLWVR